MKKKKMKEKERKKEERNDSSILWLTPYMAALVELNKNTYFPGSYSMELNHKCSSCDFSWCRYGMLKLQEIC